MNLVGYPLTCRLSWTLDVSSVFRALLDGMVFARRINVLTTDLLCCTGWCESNAKYLLVWVAFRYTFTSTSPLGRVDTLVSRNAMVGLPSTGVARSTVNWMCGLTALRWRWKLSSSAGFIHMFESSTYLNHQRGGGNHECWQSLNLDVFHYQVGNDYAHGWTHSAAENLKRKIRKISWEPK